MHEMSIAEGILEIAKNSAVENKSTRVSEIGVIIGAMSSVDEDSLVFCFSAVSRGTVAEGANIKIHHVPIKAKCNGCGTEHEVKNFNFICPKCGGILVMISGRELRVEYLEVE